MKRLNPLNDYLFQKYMGEKGDEEQLLSFLNAVLSRTGEAYFTGAAKLLKLMGRQSQGILAYRRFGNTLRGYGQIQANAKQRHKE